LELRYKGFDQTQNTRNYHFERTVKGVAKGEPAIQLDISADLAAFREHRIHIQDGPSLCAIKLASDLENSWSGQHQLTNADLVAHVTARHRAEALKIEARRRVNRSPGAAC
jgi:hypothetical protein